MLSALAPRSPSVAPTDLDEDWSESIVAKTGLILYLRPFWMPTFNDMRRVVVQAWKMFRDVQSVFHVFSDPRTLDHPNSGPGTGVLSILCLVRPACLPVRASNKV